MAQYYNGETYHQVGDDVRIDGRLYVSVSAEWLIGHGWAEVTPPTPRTPTPQEEALQRIEQLKAELATYDYIGVKIATGVATVEEYVNEINYMQSLRSQIRELEVMAYGE